MKVMFRLSCLLGLLVACARLGVTQVTVIDTGSTNIPGMNVKLENSGTAAMVERRGGATQKISLKKEVCDRFLEDLKAAGPLNALPARHCMKSVSFGTSLFIEYKGVRSPDLSCQQSDARAVALRKDATEILSMAKTNSPKGYSRPF
jgi:hypothetical protein